MFYLFSDYFLLCFSASDFMLQNDFHNNQIVPVILSYSSLSFKVSGFAGATRHSAATTRLFVWHV
jgi:hypothetical protein